MLYTNIDLKKNEVKFDWGVLHRFEVGEFGRGRKLISLPCPPDMENIKAGLHKELTIGQTKTGKPRIIKEEDNKLYVILSSEGGYTRRGCGFIHIMERDKDKIKVLALGNGADGDAGRIGTWDCALFEVSGDTTMKVRWSGSGEVFEIYVIKDGCVYACDKDSIDTLSETIDYDIPKEMFKKNDRNQIEFNYDGWLSAKYVR